jgi:hypothetical protein
MISPLQNQERGRFEPVFGKKQDALNAAGYKVALTMKTISRRSVMRVGLLN